MALDDRFFCEATADQFIQTVVDCPFKPSATKRVFFAKKGFSITTASTNLNSLTYWEGLVASGDIVPLPDGVFVDVSQNPQEGTVGIRTVKISDGETAFSYKSSLVPCLLDALSKLESNTSAYDMFIITEIDQLIGKYDGDNDVIYPLRVNSIDVRSKPLVSDGTAIEQIQDTIIIRYPEAEAKKARYFNIIDTISNLTGLRAALIGNISNDATQVTLKVVTKCEGIAIDDLTETDDFKIIDNATGLEIAITDVTPQGGGIYILDAVLVAAETYLISLNDVASNGESFTESAVSYVAV